jgi:hypothetical protein
MCQFKKHYKIGILETDLLKHFWFLIQNQKWFIYEIYTRTMHWQRIIYNC